MVKLYSRPSKDGNKKLYVDYTDNSGKRVRKSLNLLDTKSNIAYVKRNIIPEIERKLNYGLSFREYKLREFTDKVFLRAKEIQKTNTVLTYDSAIKRFFAFMGDVSVEKVRVIDIDRYVDFLKKEGLSSSTISVYLSPIQLAFKEAIRLEIIDKNPVMFTIKPSVKNKEKVVFNLMQMHQLLERAEGELKTFLYFAFFTGARPGEVISLRWCDISDGYLNIERTRVKDGTENLPKSGKSRKFKLLKPLEDYLKTLEKKGTSIFSKSYTTYASYFTALQSSMGYERRTLHVTRHTFSSLLYQAKENPTLIQYFLGHTDLTMLYKHYAHYIEDEGDVDRVSNLLLSQS